MELEVRDFYFYVIITADKKRGVLSVGPVLVNSVRIGDMLPPESHDGLGGHDADRQNNS